MCLTSYITPPLNLTGNLTLLWLPHHAMADLTTMMLAKCCTGNNRVADTRIRHLVESNVLAVMESFSIPAVLKYDA